MEELNKLQVRLVSQTMAFKGKMKKESEDENKSKKKNVNYEVLDCSLALKTLTADYNHRIAHLTAEYVKISESHQNISDQINVFKDNLQHKDELKEKQQGEDMQPENIAKLLEEKE